MDKPLRRTKEYKIAKNTGMEVLCCSLVQEVL